MANNEKCFPYKAEIWEYEKKVEWLHEATNEELVNNLLITDRMMHGQDGVEGKKLYDTVGDTGFTVNELDDAYRLLLTEITLRMWDGQKWR